MTAIANNCSQYKILAQETRSRWWKPGGSGGHQVHFFSYYSTNIQDPDSPTTFESLLIAYESLGQEIVNLLLEEPVSNIEPSFGELFSEEWKKGNARGELFSNIIY